MKRIKYPILFSVLFLLSGVNLLLAQGTAPVNQWGSTPVGSNGWDILNTASTPDGDASMGGAAAPTGWMSIRGSFDSLTATTDDAFVITGTLEFVNGGGGSGYTWLRYALFNQPNDTLHFQNTDSARWTANSNANGYIFTPVTGTGTISNTFNSWPQGNQGTEWPLINSKNWNSTNSNGGGPFSTILQAPYRQEATAGVYDWAISVQPLSSGGNEVRWYLVQEHTEGANDYYWWGGSFVDTAATATFNSVGFAFNNDFEGTQVNFSNVTVGLGDPITVPEAPFQAFYVENWGSTPVGSAWPILNDSSYLVGNASMGDGATPTGWSSIRGGFQSVTASTDKAVIVSGKLEFVNGGGGSGYTWLRYALFNQPNDTLHFQNTDSARWTANSNANGYIFTPVTGTGTISNTFNSWPQGNQGTEWPLINSKNWNSTNSNGGGPFSTILQAPYRQEATAGVYDWAISVQPLSSGGNEVRWYLVQEHTEGANDYYWWGGSFVDTAATATFNSVGFAFNNDFEGTQVNLMDVKVDKGDAITIPEAPFQAFYVENWGSTPVGSAWPILNDSSYLVGNASMGDGATPTGWSSIRGGFQSVTASTDKAVIVSGKLEFVNGGGGSGYTWLRYALFNQPNDTLHFQNTDSARWTASSNANGYIFTPVTGTGTISNTFNSWPQGNQGTEWPLINSKNWNSTNSNGGGPFSTILQAPYRQEATAGVYDWAISVQPLSSGGNEVRWYLIQEHTTEPSSYYWWGGSFVDTAATATFNSVGFAFNSDFEGTQVNLMDVKVDKGDAITIPEAPFQAFYVERWGFFGNNMGGWTFTPGELTGNASISGDAPNTEGVALRGEFQTFTPSPDRPFKITGKVDFVGGGFDASSSFRLGVFYTDSAGTLVVDTAAATQPDSTHWTGTDNYSSGYLFIPQSGSNGPVDWNGSQGTYGAVVNTVWLSPNEPNNYVLGDQVPNPSTGGAGTYDFEISVTPQGDGTSIVKCNFFNDNLNWVVSAIDNHSPLATDKFNSIAFALDAGNSITALNVTDVQIDSGTITDIDDLGNTAIPIQYSLSQNYPNPFNPSTTIEFALPQASKVSLVVYDVLGREVAKLADGNFNAGYQRINFNASNLASGVYFYRLEAGDFVSVKKLMLLK